MHLFTGILKRILKWNSHRGIPRTLLLSADYGNPYMVSNRPHEPGMQRWIPSCCPKVFLAVIQKTHNGFVGVSFKLSHLEGRDQEGEDSLYQPSQHQK